MTLITFVVDVDYDRPLKDQVDSFDPQDPRITSRNFPERSSGKVQLELTLVHFNRGMKSKEVLEEFERMDLRAATPLELVSVFINTQHRNRLDKALPIIALGSTWQRRYRSDLAVALYKDSDRLLRPGGLGRALVLDRFSRLWYSNFHFLAVKEVTCPLLLFAAPGIRSHLKIN